MKLRLIIALSFVALGCSVSVPTFAKGAGPMHGVAGMPALKLSAAQQKRLGEFNLKQSRLMHAFVKNHPRDSKAIEKFQANQGAETTAFMQKLLTPAQRKTLAAQKQFMKTHMPHHPTPQR